MCVDEAWRFWGTDSKIHKHHKSFFLEHGHFTHPDTGVACDLVLMIQDMGTLHRSVKNVVAFSFRTHKKISLGLGNTYSVQMWEGPKMNRATEIGNWTRRYNKEIFPLYSSFKGGVDGKLVNVDSRQNIFLNPRLWLIALLCLIGGGFAVRNVWNFFHPESTAPALSSPTVIPTIGAAAPPHSKYSSVFRYSGELRIGPFSYVILSDSDGWLRLESPSGFVGHGLSASGVLDGETITPFSGRTQGASGLFGPSAQSPKQSAVATQPVPSGAASAPAGVGKL